MITDADLDAILAGGSLAPQRLLADFERYEAQTSLHGFVEMVTPEFVPARHHRFLIDKLEAVERGDIKRLMVMMPPGASKSTYASIVFPAWYLGRNPRKSIIGASHSGELAERFGRRVRNLVASEPYGRMFGFGVSSNNAAAGRWETDPGGEYYAVGVDASVTGRRSDCLLIDDPVKGRAESDSATIRQRVWDWYKSDFWTRLKPNGSIILILTRWHEDDLAGRLLEEQEAGGEHWDVVSIPAIAEADDPLGREVGERLWPEWFSQEMFDIAKRDMRNWSALYQQRPVPESGDYFKSEWIRWFDIGPAKSTMRIYGASDYAVTKEGGDYTVHGIIGIDPDDDIYVLDWWREQSASDEWVEAFCDLYEQWRPLMWAEEQGQIARGVGPFLDRRLRERRLFPYRKPFASSADKQTRAQSIRGRMAMGKVYFPKREPWSGELVSELLRFDVGRNDDQVDVLSLFGRMLDRMVSGTAPKRELPIRGLREMTMDEAWKLAKPRQAIRI